MVAECPPRATMTSDSPSATISCLACESASSILCPPEALLATDSPYATITCEECEYIPVVVIPPTPSQDLILWLSCPQAVTYINGDLMFITTDDQAPTDTAFFSIWNGSYWDPIYTKSITNTDPINDPTGDYWQWEEPDIDVYTRGSITVVVLYHFHYYAAFDEFDATADVFVFNGTALLNTASIIGETIPAVAGPIYEPSYGQHELLIDSAGNIHLVIGSLNYTTYDYHVFDFQSSDNGATFTPVDVFGAQGFEGEPYFITENLAGTIIYVCQNATTNCIFKSLNYGATWALHSGGAFKKFLKDFRIMNDVFFALDRNAVTHEIYIKRSTDGSTWATVYTDAKETTLWAGVLGYDGTYYYAICNYKNAVTASTGYSEVYRSSDGINWSMVSTFTDSCITVPGNHATAHLAISTGKLAYTFYYSETIVGGDRLMAVWESVDQGVTWVIVPTLFSDQTSGTPP